MDNELMNTEATAEKHPGGRPKKQINQKQFENLCGLQCTRDEICTFFGITDKTLTRWCRETYGQSFSAVFQEKRELGKVSLRRNQWKLAEKNAAMAIFLGKNYLDQRDVQSVELSKSIDETEKELEDFFK